MKNILILIFALSAVSSVSAMGFFHEEALSSDMVPNESVVNTVKTIDTVGDTLGAVGVPFVSYAGEVAAGILSLTTILVNAARSRQKKANKTLIAGIESGTTDGAIKEAVLKRSLTDGTTATIQKAVTANT